MKQRREIAKSAEGWSTILHMTETLTRAQNIREGIANYWATIEWETTGGSPNVTISVSQYPAPGII